MSKLIPFLVAFVVALAVLLWWRGSHEEVPPPSDQLSLLDFEDDYKESVEVAKWIFENHNCQTCHTLSEAGIMGLTDLGKERSENFQGCPGMLRTVHETIHVAEEEWTPEQKKVRAEFEEFGCTTCHQVTDSTVDLTEIGSKAAVLHMTCSGVMGGLASHDEGDH